MLKLKTIAAVVCGLFVTGAAQGASAQVIVWEDIGFVSVNLGGQTGSQELTKQFKFLYFEEEATVDVTRRVKGGFLVDLTGGVAITGNWGAGISFSRRSADSDGAFTGSIPDLDFFEAPRSVSGSVPGLKHRETWFAFLGIYLLPVTDKIDVMILGGPAVVKTTHEIVTSVAVSEGSAGPELSFGRESRGKSFWGIQVGVDGRYMLTNRFDVGGFLRYSGASGNLTDDVKLELGGFQVGGGLRVRF
jgi:hypothetical protein